MSTVSALKRRLDSQDRWLQLLRRALAGGAPQSLGKGESIAFINWCKDRDITLHTRTAALRLFDMEPNRRAQPVAMLYFGAPIKNYHGVYTKEQLVPSKKRRELDRRVRAFYSLRELPLYRWRWPRGAAAP